MSKCSKPGCGAIKVMGNPCTDWDCPQQWIHHSDIPQTSNSRSSVDQQELLDLRNELEQVKADLEQSRATNRRFHRRVQELESGEAVKARKEGYWQLRSSAENFGNAWMREFDRYLSVMKIMKEIYEIAAPAVGRPYGRYLSVDDVPFDKKDGSTKGAFANVMLSPKGGVECYDIVETVRLAVGKSQNNKEEQ